MLFPPAKRKAKRSFAGGPACKAGGVWGSAPNNTKKYPQKYAAYRAFRHNKCRKTKEGLKNGQKRNSQDYLHSLDFVEAIKQARLVQPDKDALVIFAGACQSYYELLVASGANFASSPSRKNIHALDPVIITSQIASTNIKEYVDLEKVIEKTSYKQLGVGGIDTRGVARNLYPR